LGFKLGFGVWDSKLGFGIRINLGFEIRIWDLGFEIRNLGFESIILGKTEGINSYE